MKIVYYLPSLVASGGIERIITFKANYFAEHFENYDITIITSEQMGGTPYFPLSLEVKHIDIDVPIDRPYSQNRLKKYLAYPYRYYLFRKRLSKALNILSADIFISTMRRELNFINDLKDGSIKIGEFHVTRSAYGSETIQSGNLIVKALKKHLSNLFFSNVSKLKKVVLLTNEEMSDWPGFTNATVIPNPIANIHNSNVSDCMSKKVIAVGRYVHQKGFDMLISAWQNVSEKHPDWILNIYGEGDLKENYQQQITQLGLSESCFLKEPVKNIFDKYAESSIFLLSSRYEGFGMVIIEAMSCGLPVVSFSCPCGPKDIISDGDNGLLVEPNNILQFSNKINYLIENEKFRANMGNHSLLSAEKYKIENIAKLWRNLFESIKV